MSKSAYKRACRLPAQYLPHRECLAQASEPGCMRHPDGATAGPLPFLLLVALAGPVRFHDSLFQRKPDYKTRSSGGFGPHFSAVIANGPKRGRQSQSQSVFFTGGNERLEQPVLNLRRDAGARIFHFDERVTCG